MGQLRFSVSPPECITEEVLQFAYISGMDRTPWVVFAEADDNELVLEREVDDSGCATIPWHVEGHGVLMLSTGTLMERWEPYHLPLELARGTINQLRNQLFEWQSIGLDASDEVVAKLHEAVLLFGAAAVAANGSGAAKAQSALKCALDTGRLLAASYADQAIAVRRRGTGRLPSILGAQINGPLLDEATSGAFLSSFNMALVKMLWRDVEIVEGKYNWTQYDRQVAWCRAKGLRVCLGPLVQFDTSGLPDWVYIWEDDFDALQSAANQFVEAAVKRYRGKVDLWQCAARFNTSHVLKLSEDDKLRFVADLICLVKRLDPEHARTIAIDQPIGEYMGRRGCDFSPIQFVDALVRARIDIKAVLPDEH